MASHVAKYGVSELMLSFGVVNFLVFIHIFFGVLVLDFDTLVIPIENCFGVACVQVVVHVTFGVLALNFDTIGISLEELCLGVIRLLLDVLILDFDMWLCFDLIDASVLLSLQRPWDLIDVSTLKPPVRSGQTYKFFCNGSITRNQSV